jgi:hypothetical protein
MRQGSKLALAVALLFATGAFTFDTAASQAATRPYMVAAASKSTASSKSKSKYNNRQFSGYVTSSDPSTLTVEKRGKKPRTVVFARHAEMKTTGEVEKNAYVTVYYRDEGGKPVAHKVVAKPAP